MPSSPAKASVSSQHTTALWVNGWLSAKPFTTQRDSCLWLLWSANESPRGGLRVQGQAPFTSEAKAGAICRFALCSGPTLYGHSETVINRHSAHYGHKGPRGEVGGVRREPHPGRFGRTVEVRDWTAGVTLWVCVYRSFPSPCRTVARSGGLTSEPGWTVASYAH